MNNVIEPLVTIAAAVVGLAIVAVLVSKNAQTTSVIGATGSAFSNVLSAATGPITGAVAAPNVNGPSGGGFGSFNLGGLTGSSLGLAG